MPQLVVLAVDRLGGAAGCVEKFVFVLYLMPERIRLRTVPDSVRSFFVADKEVVRIIGAMPTPMPRQRT
jgi:hypothetical protein